MRLSDIKGVDAINTAADLLEPIALIAECEGIKEARKQLAADVKAADAEQDKKKASKMRLHAKIHFGQRLLKACPEHIIEVFAILNQTPVEEYDFSLATLPQAIAELMNDPYILQLFGLQSETPTSSGSAMATTEVEEK